MGSLRQLVRAYDAQPVKLLPTLKTSAGFDLVIASPAGRNQASAMHIFGRIDATWPALCEAELPDLWPRSLSAPAMLWLILARVLWRLGRGTNCENYLAFIQRSEDCADALIEQTQQNQRIAVVGHAFTNRAIGKALLANGFQRLSRHGSGHWATTRFARS